MVDGVGRPTNYQPRMAAKICEAIAEGRSLREICGEPGMPSRESVRRWHARHEDFRQQYDAARLLAADLIADDINDMLDALPDAVRAAAAAGINENAVVSAHRTQLDGKKWLLSKIAPARYGDRIEVAGNPAAPLIPVEIDNTKIALAIVNLLTAAKPPEFPSSVTVVDVTPLAEPAALPQPAPPVAAHQAIPSGSTTGDSGVVQLQQRRLALPSSNYRK
jgi:hypothetical protein